MSGITTVLFLRKQQVMAALVAITLSCATAARAVTACVPRVTGYEPSVRIRKLFQAFPPAPASSR